MKLIIVRHGQAYEGTDTLTSLGKKQAQLLAKRLKKEHIDFIYSSPLKRAKDTATYICKERKQKATYEDILSEVQDTIITQPRKLWKTPQAYQKTIRNISTFLTQLHNTHADHTILIVGHGKLNRVIMSILLHINLHTLRAFQQKHTCVNILKEGTKDEKYIWKLILLNCTAHLPQDLNTVANKISHAAI